MIFVIKFLILISKLPGLLADESDHNHDLNPPVILQAPPTYCGNLDILSEYFLKSIVKSVNTCKIEKTDQKSKFDSNCETKEILSSYYSNFKECVNHYKNVDWKFYEFYSEDVVENGNQNTLMNRLNHLCGELRDDSSLVFNSLVTKLGWVKSASTKNRKFYKKVKLFSLGNTPHEKFSEATDACRTIFPYGYSRVATIFDGDLPAVKKICRKRGCYLKKKGSEKFLNFKNEIVDYEDNQIGDALCELYCPKCACENGIPKDSAYHCADTRKNRCEYCSNYATLSDDTCKLKKCIGGIAYPPKSYSEDKQCQKCDADRWLDIDSNKCLQYTSLSTSMTSKTLYRVIPLDYGTHASRYSNNYAKNECKNSIGSKGMSKLANSNIKRIVSLTDRLCQSDACLNMPETFYKHKNGNYFPIWVHTGISQEQMSAYEDQDEITFNSPGAGQSSTIKIVRSTTVLDTEDICTYLCKKKDQDSVIQEWKVCIDSCTIPEIRKVTSSRALCEIVV